MKRVRRRKENTLTFRQRHFLFALMRGKGSTKTFAFFFTPSLPASSLTLASGFCKKKKKEKETSSDQNLMFVQSSIGGSRVERSIGIKDECTTLNQVGVAASLRVSLLTKPALLGWPKSDS